MLLASNKQIKSSDLEGGVKTLKSEKKDTLQYDACNALVVNGSVKVEKTLNDEKPIIKVEGIANLPANQNRKRSLSEPSVEFVAKTPKLKKFAGIASLTTNKKGQLNRSARRYQQFKDKKKALSKVNKRQIIREKIFGGDIEALREIQIKLDALLAKPVLERSKSARRKIRKFRNWLNFKTKKSEDSNTSLTTDANVKKPRQKKNQQKIKNGQQAVKNEFELVDNEASDEEDSDDIDEEDSDYQKMTSQFIVDV